MGEEGTLFDALSASLLDSFSPDVDYQFSLFESWISGNKHNNFPNYSTKTNESYLNDAIQLFLKDFPHNHFKYSNIISTLASFASSNPILIISNICNKFMNELNRTQSHQPEILSINSISFQPSYFHHFLFLHYLNLIVLTDLIKTLFIQYPNRQPIPKIVKCGYTLCITNNHQLSQLHFELIKTWSEIFHYVSKISLEEISLSLEQYSSDYISNSYIFTLVSQVYANQAFIDTLLYSLKYCRRHKLITSEMLTAIASIFSLVDCSEDVLNEFFTIAWSVKGLIDVKEGAIDLICVLFNKLPQQQKKSTQFYMNKVYKHSEDETKVERSAKAFLRQIRGDISNYKSENDPHFFNCCGSQTTDSFSSIFMKIFFTKANFNICSSIFCDILAHLVSVEFSAFEKILLPSFLKLDIFSSKFVSFLDALKLINSKSFYENSFCKVTKKQIESINEMARPAVIDSLEKIKKYTENSFMQVTNEVLDLQPIIDESDHSISDFLSINNFLTFDPISKPLLSRDPSTNSSDNSNSLNNQNGQIIEENDLIMKAIPSLLKVIPYVIDREILENTDIPFLLIKFMCHSDFQISATSNHVYSKMILVPRNIEIFVQKIFDNFFCSVEEVTSQCLHLLYSIIRSENTPKSLISSIETYSFCMLVNDSPYCRGNALKILRHISATGLGSIYSIIRENSHTIVEAVNRSILVINVPSKPSTIKPPIGFIDWERACCSRYNDLWLIFIAEISNIFIEKNMNDFLLKCRQIFYLLKEKKFSDFTLSAIFLLYLDSYALETLKLNTKDFNTNSNSHNIKFVENHNNNSDESNFGASALVKIIFSMDDVGIHKNLITAYRYVNWRVIPLTISLFLSSPHYLIADIASALSFIIQNPCNFNNIISSIFRKFMEFLSTLQSHFIQLNINSAREIIWDEERISILRQHQDLCVNYCILISAAFNNIQEQISEDDCPLSYRQVLVQFLIHWAQLPPEFEKIQAYAINALIPIIHAGTVFADGYSFELPILEMMLQCQLSGYPVLDTLLLFHLDILLDVYVKNCLIRNKREAQPFFDAILAVIDYCNDASVLQAHLGYLILLALLIGIRYEEQNITYETKEPSIIILTKVASLFIDTVHDHIIKYNQGNGQIISESNDDSETRDNFSPKSIVNRFRFAAEQVIEAGFDILHVCTKITLAKSIVQVLTPFFQKIRLLPTHNFIVQGVPSKYRKFTVASFFDSMFEVSSTLNEEICDVFANFWYTLLQSRDNSVVVLLFLFENGSNEIKERTFGQILEREPALISKYLSKRCTFAYWYFMRTQRKLNTSSINWIIPVLTRSFTDFIDSAAPNYTACLHYSLLFIEECKELFEALIAVFGLEAVDSQFIWTREGPNNAIHAASIVADILVILVEQKQDAIVKWSQEAIRWAIACCDIKIGYRSLVILNALQTELPQSFIPLIAKAVLYHLSRVSEDDCQEVALFVGECFDIFYRQINNADVATFAFRFASLFLHCPAFEEHCLKRAIPIFLACTQHAVLMRSAQDILPDAFIPFLSNLETDDEAQQLLVQISEIASCPDLLLVAAAFLAKPLPFIDIGRTAKDIFSMQISSNDATKALTLYGKLLKTASGPLTESIFNISTDLLNRFEHSIERSCLVPIYQAALPKAAMMKSAVNFMTALLRIDPGIATLSKEAIVSNMYIDEIKKGLNELVDKSTEIVPITNCKQISQLNGIIDQTVPPKILPFSPQFEMFLGLRKDAETSPRKRSRTPRRWSSSMSLSSLSFFSKTALINHPDQSDFSDLKLMEIPIRPIKLNLLETANDEGESFHFVISPDEFLNLEE
ncbi:hypothetical protein TRFO_32767 [Tritrichomonas foetus]|uniref:Uncharacterized protein n=1 Tax=Tritrichomonas foetus TaxID=1144522 RepID=A0A1J4JN45_9EUKA|nr:hypothetical protein TRFO_32767 [Tritrichomonas foetus]|eukprot:OHT00499.1 hypothetical protein TRFO_32767 [Tritrichomonas foetus]